MDVATLGIRVDANGAITVLDKFGKTVDKVDAKTSHFESTVKKLGAFLAGGFVAHKFLHETIMAQDAIADLESAVRVLGGTSGKTFKELNELSEEMQRLTRFSDESAKGALAMLLTFGKIDGSQMRDVAFIAADLATRMKTDLVGAAQMVGRALQDPSLGITMINRQFRLFNESQVETIKRLQDTGRFAEAQAVVFNKLQATFGGAAAASRKTLGGALEYLKNTFGDLFEVSQGGTSLLVKGINALGDAFVRLRPYVATALALVGASVTAWLTYQTVLKSVAAWHAIVAGAETIRAFITLALSIRKAADAAALLSLVGGSLVKVAAAVAALALGWYAYKKVMEQVNKESEKFTAGLPNVPGPATSSDETTKFQKDLLFQNEERVRLARQELGLVTKTGYVLEHQQHVNEAINEEDRIAHERGLESARQLDDATVRSIADARALKDEASLARMQFEAIKQVMENTIRGVQTAFSNFFHDLFTDGIRSFQSLANAFKELFTRAIAEILASKLMHKILSVMSGNGDTRSTGVQQVAAAATMLTAAQAQVSAANLMAAAAGLQQQAAGGPQGGAPGKPGSSITRRVGSGLAGLGIGYGLGSSMGGVGGVLAGGLGGAASGFAIAGPAGALIGGLSGVVGGLFGAASASRAHREELRQAQLQYERFTDTLKLSVGEMSDVEAQIKELHRQADEQRRILTGSSDGNTSGHVGARLSDEGRNQLNEINRLEAERVRQLQEEAAAIKKSKTESIQADLLEVNGDARGAAALRLKIQQEEEYNQAVKDHLDEATLATLRYVQAKKAEKAAADAFVTTALNIPEGYRTAAAQFRATQVNPFQPGWEAQSKPTGTIPALAPSGGGNGGSDQPVLLIMDGQVVARGVVRNLQRMASAQKGDPSRWPEVSVS